LFHKSLQGMTVKRQQMELMDRIKGFSVKESEISRGLVSPAREALKKIGLPRILAGKIPHQANIRPTPPTGDS